MKSLADHLLRDDSGLKEGVQPARKGLAWAISPRGLCCDRIVYKPYFKPWSRSVFVWGYLGLLWALIHLGLLSGDVGPKAMVLIGVFCDVYIKLCGKNIKRAPIPRKYMLVK